MHLYQWIPLDARLKALGWLVGIPALRPPLWRALSRITERHMIERNETLLHWPEPVQQDKVVILKAIMASMERGLAEGLIGKQPRHKLTEIFLGKSVFRSSANRKRFIEEHGIVPPGLLAISPTARCNLSCTGCYAGSDTSQRAALPVEAFDRILREKEELWGSHFTVISGGEPFLYEDRKNTLLDILERHPNQYFLIYTNGTLLNCSVARRLAELGNVTPAISVEGLEWETDNRRGKGTFKRILKTFDNLRHAGVPFGVSITAFRDNAERVLDDEHIDFFLQQGALYSWVFQYMPIGRNFDPALMVTAEQRKHMFERTWQLIRERQLFITDFWNCGTATNGCIAAAGSGGYFYIDWNGNVAPCVFNPFTVHNVQKVFADGGDLNTIVFSPFFSHIRKWQQDYFYNRTNSERGNLIAPCPYRDHYAEMRKIAIAADAHPLDTDGRQAFSDVAYAQELTEYGDDYRAMTNQLWDELYLGMPRREEVNGKATHRQEVSHTG